MKLKFLFVPLSILISIVLVIWYIWPTWFGSEGIREYQKRIDIKKCELEEADFKVKNAESLKNFMSSTDGKVSVDKIYKYFPVEEKNENIINDINYIGNSSSVSIIGINVESEELKDGEDKVLTIAKGGTNKKSSSTPMAKACLDRIAEKYGDVSDMDISYLDPFAGLDGGSKEIISEIEGTKENSIVSIKANIKVAGSYKQLIIFLDNLYRMRTINNVSSINIYKDDNKRNEDDAVSNVDFLSMDVSAYFAYLPTDNNAALGFDDPIFEKKSFDLTAINKLNKIVEIPEINIGDTGKDNPFIP